MLNKARNMIYKQQLKNIPTTKPGRPRLEVDIKKIIELKKQGLSNRAVAKELNVSPSKINKVINTIKKK